MTRIFTIGSDRILNPLFGRIMLIIRLMKLHVVLWTGRSFDHIYLLDIFFLRGAVFARVKPVLSEEIAWFFFPKICWEMCFVETAGGCSLQPLACMPLNYEYDYVTPPYLVVTINCNVKVGLHGKLGKSFEGNHLKRANTNFQFKLWSSTCVSCLVLILKMTSHLNIL